MQAPELDIPRCRRAPARRHFTPSSRHGGFFYTLWTPIFFAAFVKT